MKLLQCFLFYAFAVADLILIIAGFGSTTPRKYLRCFSPAEFFSFRNFRRQKITRNPGGLACPVAL
jgi:hypothetical protein